MVVCKYRRIDILELDLEIKIQTIDLNHSIQSTY
jgi:hypothetical protein